MNVRKATLIIIFSVLTSAIAGCLLKEKPEMQQPPIPQSTSESTLNPTPPVECIPLPYATFDQFPRPGARAVPATTNISISISRPPSIVELKIKPEVEINNITREGFGVTSEKITFHPTKPLEPGTAYTITVTYGQKNQPKGDGNFCLTSNVSWEFTTAYDTKT